MGYYANWIGLFIGFLVMLLGAIASIVLVVVVLVKLPVTYFQDCPRPALIAPVNQSGFHWLVWLVRNILGLALVIGGIFLSIPGIPGQGILTILIGVLVLDLPGKRWLERKLIGRPRIFRAVNRLRSRFGTPALVLESERDKGERKD